MGEFLVGLVLGFVVGLVVACKWLLDESDPGEAWNERSTS